MSWKLEQYDKGDVFVCVMYLTHYVKTHLHLGKTVTLTVRRLCSAGGKSKG